LKKYPSIFFEVLRKTKIYLTREAELPFEILNPDLSNKLQEYHSF